MVRRMVTAAGAEVGSLIGNTAALRTLRPADFVDDSFGLPTVTDILQELEKPGRDPRPVFKTATFKDGVEKIGDMCVQFAPAELERFHGVKRAFDAEGLLNPGKAVPTLHRCAEMGRMHVHRGELPHPELPRF